MANVEERIKQLESELAQLRGMQQWGQVGAQLKESFSGKYDDEDKMSVSIGIKSPTGDYDRDWDIPFPIAKTALAQAGTVMQRHLDQLGKAGKPG